MSATTTTRPANEQGQFILPAIPTATNPALAALVAEYHAGFVVIPEEEHHRWEDAAQLIRDFEPASLADLAAKMIIAIHYRDPEIKGDALAIQAPEESADRLAIEMELASLDWLLARASPPPSHAAFDAALAEFWRLKAIESA